MSIRFFFPVLAAVMAACIGAAAQQNRKMTMAVDKVPATDGRQCFMNYCASCHGSDGRGNGPVASSLKVPPNDLTQLSKNNDGKYPARRIAAVLQFGLSAPAHGTALMPVWGPVFDKMDRSSSPASTSSPSFLRVNNLNEYIRGMQAK